MRKIYILVLIVLNIAMWYLALTVGNASVEGYTFLGFMSGLSLIAIIIVLKSLKEK